MDDMLISQASMPDTDAAGLSALSRFPLCDDLETFKIIASYQGSSILAICQAAAEAHSSSGHSSESGSALSVLINLGENALPEGLLLLQDPDPDIRRQVSEVLRRKITGKKSAYLLRSSLADDVPVDSAAAVAALGQLESPEMTGSVHQAIQKLSSWVRFFTSTAQGSLAGNATLAVPSWNAHAISIAELCAAIRAMGRTGASDPLLIWNFLMECFASGDDVLQNAVLVALGELFARGLKLPGISMQLPSKVVVNKIHDPNQKIRLAVAHVLSVSIDPKVVRGLRVLAHDSSDEVKEVALHGLIESGIYTALDLVRVAKKQQGSVEVRILALRKISQIFDPSAELSDGIDQKLERIIKDCAYEPVAAAAICALLTTSPAKGIPLVLAIFQTGIETQKDIIIQELAYCQPHVLSLLMAEGYDDRQLRLVMFQLFQLGKNSGFLGDSVYGRSLLIASLGDEDWMIRAYTVSILTGIKTLWAYNLVRNACFDIDDRVRMRALDAILKGDPLKVDPAWLQMHRLDGSIYIRNLIKDFQRKAAEHA